MSDAILDKHLWLKILIGMVLGISFALLVDNGSFCPAISLSRC